MDTVIWISILCYIGTASSTSSHIPSGPVLTYPPIHSPHLPPFKHPYCNPTIPPPCSYNGTNYCLDDKEYPLYEIKSAIETDYLFLKKYSDVPEQSANDLVSMVTKEQEEYFDYRYYSGASAGPTPFDISHWEGPEGYICPSFVSYITPKRAKNVEGHWRVIVNKVHYYTQTARLESCIFPESACRVLAPCYKSHCTQKFAYHRLLSYDPCDPFKGLFIDVYRFPSACSCHIVSH